MLKDPVSMVNDSLQRDDVFLDRLQQACLEKSNKVLVRNPLATTVSRLAYEIVCNYVYLVITAPDHKCH